MGVEQLVQRQTKQELVDDRDRMIESAVFGDEVITEDGIKSLEHKILNEQRANPDWAGHSDAVTKDKSLSSPHEFMGSRSKQWSQRYKGLLMDFEGAERRIKELELQYESAMQREELLTRDLNKQMANNCSIVKSKEHKVNELNAKLCGANDTIAKLQQEVDEYSAMAEQEHNLSRLRAKGMKKLKAALVYINDKDLFNLDAHPGEFSEWVRSWHMPS